MTDPGWQYSSSGRKPVGSGWNHRPMQTIALGNVPGAGAAGREPDSLDHAACFPDAAVPSTCHLRHRKTGAQP